MQAPSSLQAVWPVRAEWLTVVTRHQDDHTRSIAFLGDQDADGGSPPPLTGYAPQPGRPLHQPPPDDHQRKA